MDRIWDRIENWLASHAPEISEGLNPPASIEEMDRTERLLGIQFPDDVKASYFRHNGQSEISPGMIDAWEWLSLERIRSEWTIWKELVDGGDFADIQNDTDGHVVRVDWWSPAWIPLTYSGSGDHHCLDLAPGPEGSVGQIIEMWHDEGSRPVVANDFRSWLSALADDMESGELILSDEIGGLCRRDEA